MNRLLLRKPLFRTSLFILLVLASSASAQWFWGPQFGGSGGTEFDFDTCRLGFQTGLFGGHGRVIDRIGRTCDDNGSLPPEFGAAHGGGGGNGFTTTCRSNYVVKGIQGRSARLVDRVQLICVEKADIMNRRLETLDWNYPAFGGTGGTYFSYRCPEEHAAIGIHGASGSRLDRLGFICSDASTVPQ